MSIKAKPEQYVNTFNENINDKQEKLGMKIRNSSYLSYDMKE